MAEIEPMKLDQMKNLVRTKINSLAEAAAANAAARAAAAEAAAANAGKKIVDNIVDHITFFGIINSICMLFVEVSSDGSLQYVSELHNQLASVNIVTTSLNDKFEKIVNELRIDDVDLKKSKARLLDLIDFYQVEETSASVSLMDIIYDREVEEDLPQTEFSSAKYGGNRKQIGGVDFKMKVIIEVACKALVKMMDWTAQFLSFLITTPITIASMTLYIGFMLIFFIIISILLFSIPEDIIKDYFKSIPETTSALFDIIFNTVYSCQEFFAEIVLILMIVAHKNISAVTSSITKKLKGLYSMYEAFMKKRSLNQQDLTKIFNDENKIIIRRFLYVLANSEDDDFFTRGYNIQEARRITRKQFNIVQDSFVMEKDDERMNKIHDKKILKVLLKNTPVVLSSFVKFQAFPSAFSECYDFVTIYAIYEKRNKQWKDSYKCKGLDRMIDVTQKCLEYIYIDFETDHNPNILKKLYDDNIKPIQNELYIINANVIKKINDALNAKRKKTREEREKPDVDYCNIYKTNISMFTKSFNIILFVARFGLSYKSHARIASDIENSMYYIRDFITADAFFMNWESSKPQDIYMYITDQAKFTAVDITAVKIDYKIPAVGAKWYNPIYPAMEPEIVNYSTVEYSIPVGILTMGEHYRANLSNKKEKVPVSNIALFFRTIYDKIKSEYVNANMYLNYKEEQIQHKITLFLDQLSLQTSIHKSHINHIVEYGLFMEHYYYYSYNNLSKNGLKRLDVESDYGNFYIKRFLLKTIENYIIDTSNFKFMSLIYYFLYNYHLAITKFIDSLPHETKDYINKYFIWIDFINEIGKLLEQFKTQFMINSTSHKPQYVSIYDTANTAKYNDEDKYINIKGVDFSKNQEQGYFIAPRLNLMKFHIITGTELKLIMKTPVISTPSFTSKPVSSSLFSKLSKHEQVENNVVDVNFIKRRLSRITSDQYNELKDSCKQIEIELGKYFHFNIDEFTDPGNIYLKYEPEDFDYDYFTCLDVHTEYKDEEPFIQLLYPKERNSQPAPRQESATKNPSFKPKPPSEPKPEITRPSHGGTKRTKKAVKSTTKSKQSPTHAPMKLTYMHKVRTVYKDKNNDKYIKSQGQRVYLKDIRGKYKYVKE